MTNAGLELPRFYLIVASMGMVNAAVEHIEGLPIGLTYVTGALSRFGRGIGRWMLGDRHFEWTIQIVPWLGMLAGCHYRRAADAGRRRCGAVADRRLRDTDRVCGAVDPQAAATALQPDCRAAAVRQRVR
jgi:hypothetical protein